MKIEEVKQYFGSWYRYEKETGFSHSNCTYWEKIGYIPILSQLKIEEFTKGVLKSSYLDGEGKLHANKS